MYKRQRSEFADDGYTGTNFHRPQFTQMMEKVKRGEIDPVSYTHLDVYKRQLFESLPEGKASASELHLTSKQRCRKNFKEFFERYSTNGKKMSVVK